MARPESEEALPEGLLGADQVACEHLGDHALVGPARHGGVFEDGLGLGAPPEMMSIEMVVEGLDPERITGAHEPSRGPVPDRHREIPDELAREVLAPAFIGAKDQLGVVLGAGGQAPGHERIPERSPVVDATVQSRHELHGRMAPRLDLAPRLGSRPEGLMAHGDRSRRPCVLSIASAVRERGQHPLEDEGLGAPTVESEKTCETTHGALRDTACSSFRSPHRCPRSRCPA